MPTALARKPSKSRKSLSRAEQPIRKGTAKNSSTPADRKSRKLKVETPTAPVQVGKAYSFEYPRHNFHGVLSKLEPRRIRVESVRDCYDDNLERMTIEIQPLIRRAQYLITGQDLDKNEERSFYSDSMKRISEMAADEIPVLNDSHPFLVIEGTRIKFTAETAKGAKRLATRIKNALIVVRFDSAACPRKVATEGGAL